MKASEAECVMAAGRAAPVYMTCTWYAMHVEDCSLLGLCDRAGTNFLELSARLSYVQLSARSKSGRVNARSPLVSTPSPLLLKFPNDASICSAALEYTSEKAGKCWRPAVLQHAAVCTVR
jgi:hypothetical protein